MFSRHLSLYKSNTSIESGQQTVAREISGRRAAGNSQSTNSSGTEEDHIYDGQMTSPESIEHSFGDNKHSVKIGGKK